MPTLSCGFDRRSLEHEKAFIHGDGEIYRITRSGLRHVETNHLLDSET